MRSADSVAPPLPLSKVVNEMMALPEHNKVFTLWVNGLGIREDYSKVIGTFICPHDRHVHLSRDPMLDFEEMRGSIIVLGEGVEGVASPELVQRIGELIAFLREAESTLLIAHTSAYESLLAAHTNAGIHKSL
jgi:hypothetical protein